MFTYNSKKKHIARDSKNLVTDWPNRSYGMCGNIVPKASIVEVVKEHDHDICKRCKWIYFEGLRSEKI